jgi:hypothetical protein
MIVFDAHVHYHDCFRQDAFFAGAAANFSKLASDYSIPPEDATYCLLLAEMAGQNYFSTLLSVARSSQRVGAWTVVVREEGLSLQVTRENAPQKSFLLAAGRQLVSAEGLEVLALMTAEDFAEGQKLDQLVESIVAVGGLAVCPWGAGKWLGARGRRLRAFLQGHHPGFFLGDNGGRPGFWRQRELGQARGSLLSGSDPLPLAGEERRVGSYGGILRAKIVQSMPIRSLKELLADDSAQVEPYGAPLGALAFATKQIALRMR